jgi:hypothetical protein
VAGIVAFIESMFSQSLGFNVLMWTLILGVLVGAVVAIIVNFFKKELYTPILIAIMLFMGINLVIISTFKTQVLALSWDTGTMGIGIGLIGLAIAFWQFADSNAARG